MVNLSVQTVVGYCLGRSGSLSLLKDVFGVYGSSTQIRSLTKQLDLIRNKPFVRVTLVTIQGATPDLQRDLDNANIVYQNECGCWVYCARHFLYDKPHLLWLDQDDCKMPSHSVSAEEAELFDLGRVDANIVCYYINGDGASHGCAAHPPGRRGFWVGAGASPWTFVHELTHVVGDNSHCNGDTSCAEDDTDNLMYGGGTENITNPPPDLTNSQCTRIINDPDMKKCG